jgi:hydroxyethylthiazole kinase-like uncharacterized protein yjeF
MVAVVGGAMPGAAELAAGAALRAGAGYVLLVERHAQPGTLNAVVRRVVELIEEFAAALRDKRIGALLVGPGLGRDEDAQERLRLALDFPGTLIVDGDALVLLGPAGLDHLRRRMGSTILTPHAGEFAAMFGVPAGSKIDQARDAARSSGGLVVYKGPDTVLAAPDGRVVVGPAASPWLSTAGTGDVLAGTIAACCAGSSDPFGATSTALWLHAEAARQAGPGFVADDVAEHLGGALQLGLTTIARSVLRA